jgi:PKD repeat protein
MHYFLLLNAMVLFSTVFTYAQTTFRIRINQPPKLELITEKDSLIELGESIELGNLISVSGGTTPYIYIWSPDATLNNSTIQNPVATPNENITYYLVVTDNNRCTVTDTIKVNIQVSTDIIDAGKPEIIIFPVPVSNGILYVRLVDVNRPLNFSILDLNGKIIKRSIIPTSGVNTVFQIPLFVKPGTYILKIYYDNTSVAKQFIVTQK